MHLDAVPSTGIAAAKTTQALPKQEGGTEYKTQQEAQTGYLYLLIPYPDEDSPYQTSGQPFMYNSYLNFSLISF